MERVVNHAYIVSVYWEPGWVGNAALGSSCAVGEIAEDKLAILMLL